MATIAQCARHLDMTERRFYELLDEGVVDRVEKRGAYDLDVVRLQYIRHLRDVAAGRGDDVERGDGEATARARKEEAQAGIAELELAERKHELIPADQVADAFNVVVSNVRTRLLSVPAKAAPVVGAKDPAKAEAVIRGEINEALEDLAQVEIEGIAA